MIFDLDGVLVSTSIYHAQAWASLVRSLGYEPPADLEERVKGISRIASLKIALGANAADYTEDELVELASHKNEHYLKLVRDISPGDLFPGVLDLFEDLRRSGISIVLGSASKNARPILDSLEIGGYFDAVADGYEYRHGKPHPDVFLAGARMVGAEFHVVENDSAPSSRPTCCCWRTCCPPTGRQTCCTPTGTTTNPAPCMRLRSARMSILPSPLTSAIQL